MDWSKFSEYGLEGLVICALFYTLYKIINYTMKFIDKSTEQQAKEREAWVTSNISTIETIKAIQASVQLHNQQSIDAHNIIKEAGVFQRTEHKEMIENLKEITNSLGRINGYKHD
jgi:hypothetical protein